MALKFGSLFDAFKGNPGGGNKKDVDTSGTDDAVKQFKAISDQAELLGKSMESLYEEYSKLEAGVDTETERVRIEKELQRLQIVSNKLDKELDVQLKLLDKETLKYTKDQKDYFKFLKADTKTLDSVQTDYDSNLKALIEDYKTGKLKSDEFKAGLEKIKMDKFGGQITAMFNKSGEDITKDLGSSMSNVVGEIAPEFQILAAIVQAAYGQILEMNNALIDLQRATGGVITATKLGYDVYGNAKNGMDSLKTAAIAANVSIGQISEALQSLYSNGFSTSMIGIDKSLDSTGKALADFGIQSAEMKKMYQADIGPAVQGFMKNFGMK